MAARFVVLYLIGVSVSIVLGQELAVEPGTVQKVAEGPSDVGSFDDLRQGRIVAAQSRKTITTITTSITTVPATCHTTINPVACRRKRRSTYLVNDRRILRAIGKNIGGDLAAADGLDGSLGSSVYNEEKDEGDENSAREGKLAYTVWWSTTSTYTVVSRVNSGITVSVSYFCSVVGATYPPLCG